MKTKHPVTSRRAIRNEGGFTLIEMMVAITIGLAIIAGLLTVLASNSSSSKTNERTSELLTNGRYALNSLKHEFRQAGYRGYTWAEPNALSTSIGTLTGECLETGATAGSFVPNIRQGLWGANNSNPFSGNCIPAATYASDASGKGDDVLVIRRLADEPATTLLANTFYFHSSYGVGEVFRGTTAPAFTGSPTPLADFSLQVYVYYISPYTTSATESPKVPALYRVALRSDGSMTRELVASGIEHFQVQYGRLSTVPDTRYYDTVAGTSSNTSPSDWDEVNSVRIWLLARNAAAEPGYVNTSSYAMGDQVFTVNDSFRRQLFTTVVQLRN
jgi:type IV pilus assembly protein PilW